MTDITNPLKIKVHHTDDDKIISTKKVQSNLSLPTALKLIESPLFDDYATTLYRFATIIAKADKIVSKEDEEILKEIYQLTHNPIPEKKLREVVTTAFANREKSFGNGRFVRNIFEKTLETQANRIASLSSLTKEILITITPEDIDISLS
jgi:hypothetical protein